MEQKREMQIDWPRLFRMSGLLHRVIDAHFKHDYDRITVRQVRVAEEVFFRGGTTGMRLKDLAQRLNISPSAASQAVDSLVSIGVLNRRASESDRREVVLTVTDDLRAKCLEHDLFLEQKFTGLLTTLSMEEKQVFSRVLEKIVNELEGELEK